MHAHGTTHTPTTVDALVLRVEGHRCIKRITCACMHEEKRNELSM